LAPAIDPVVTPRGVLLSREAAVSHLLSDKRARKRELDRWRARRDGAAADAEMVRAGERAAEVVAYERAQSAGLSARAATAAAGAMRAVAAADRAAARGEGAPGERSAPGVRARQEAGGEDLSAGCFWTKNAHDGDGRRTGVGPSTTMTAVGPRPDVRTRCPVTGEPLSLVDLIPVRFTPFGVRDGDASAAAAAAATRASGGARAPLYECAISRDPLGNRQDLVVIASTGDVITRAAYERLVRPDGRMPNGTVVRPGPPPDGDVIPLMRGGTGFAAKDGAGAEATVKSMLGKGGLAGKNDSRFGLRLKR